MTLLDLGLAGLALSFALALVRAVRGPSVADRALAADVCLYAIVGAIALLTLRTTYEEFLDVILIATLLGFLATIALGALVGRRDS
ncbi:monovalent cation/H+ antiporter complex subunit F [Egicoccus sp. AB-alg6-2]|uniref:monovalent cation/H+ antiporter complex subunit F n=1 Tax=Egicoccus sp. AB-alg6-2 TaxID=3242692 RepID=UPI00359EE887